VTVVLWARIEDFSKRRAARGVQSMYQLTIAWDKEMMQ